MHNICLAKSVVASQLRHRAPQRTAAMTAVADVCRHSQCSETCMKKSADIGLTRGHFVTRQSPRVCSRQSNVLGQFYMLFKLYRWCVKMFHIIHKEWIVYRPYFVIAGRHNIIEITDRLFSAWGYPSLLSPDVIAFLKSQKGYL